MVTKLHKEIRKIVRLRVKEIEKRENKTTLEYCKKHKYQEVCNTDKERKEFLRQHNHIRPLWNRVLEFIFSLPARLLHYVTDWR